MIANVPLQSIVVAMELKIPLSKSMEEIIAKNAEISYFYSLNIIKKRFPEGELEICKFPEIAVDYARYILKNRFNKAENNIAKSPKFCYNYFKYVIKNKLPNKMHKSMLIMSFENPINEFVEKYFKEI
jgi:hypothetical protein